MIDLDLMHETIPVMRERAAIWVIVLSLIAAVGVALMSWGDVPRRHRYPMVMFFGFFGAAIVFLTSPWNPLFATACATALVLIFLIAFIAYRGSLDSRKAVRARLEALQWRQQNLREFDSAAKTLLPQRGFRRKRASAEQVRLAALHRRRELAAMREDERRLVNRRIWISAPILVLTTAALAAAVVTPDVQVERHRESTPAALDESVRGVQLIRDAVEETYEVEIVTSLPDADVSSEMECLAVQLCFRSDEVQRRIEGEAEQRERTAFIDAATSGDVDEAPSLRLLTSSGVLAQYGVMLDNDTGEVRIVIESNNTDAPSPEDLLRSSP